MYKEAETAKYIQYTTKVNVLECRNKHQLLEGITIIFYLNFVRIKEKYQCDINQSIFLPKPSIANKENSR